MLVCFFPKKSKDFCTGFHIFVRINQQNIFSVMKKKRSLITLLLAACLSLTAAQAQVKPYMQEGPNPTQEARQGSCASGKYFFQFHNANGTIEIYNLKTRQRLQIISQPPVKSQHCNTVCFGAVKYDKADRLPLLYVSTERDSKILVYRILGEDGNMSLQTVQTLTLPPCEEMGLYFPNSVIDGQGKKLWLSGFSCNSWQKPDGGNHLRYIELPLPDVRQGDVTIDLGQKLSEFTLPFTYATQGIVYHRGRIIQAYGVRHQTNLIRIIDPQSGKVERTYYPHKLDMDQEPEGCFIYKGKPMISTVEGDLYFVRQFEQK